MTVAEMIEKLRGCDPDADVFVLGTNEELFFAETVESDICVEWVLRKHGEVFSQAYKIGQTPPPEAGEIVIGPMPATLIA